MILDFSKIPGQSSTPEEDPNTKSVITDESFDEFGDALYTNQKLFEQPQKSKSIIKIVRKKLDKTSQLKRQQTSFENYNKSLDKYLRRNNLKGEQAKGIENLKKIM